MLGPVLFLVFIDDLEKGLRSDVLKFADDTKIFRRVDSEVDKDVLQVYKDGIGVEGLGVWGETGEVGIVDLGGEKKSFGSGGVVQDLKRTVCHSFGQAIPKEHSMKLAKESFKLEVRKNFFSQGVVNNWNWLSEEMVSARKFDAFGNWKIDFLMDYVR